MKTIKVKKEVFDSICDQMDRLIPKNECPCCKSEMISVCYSDELKNNPAVGCMICGLLVMSSDGKEDETIRLWNLLPRK
jgi:transcription elongation factor Elf1